MDITIKYKGGAYIIKNEDIEILRLALVIIPNYNDIKLVKLDLSRVTDTATQYSAIDELQKLQIEVAELQAKIPVLQEHAQILESLADDEE